MANQKNVSATRAAAPVKSKTDIILGLLRRKNGASIEDIAKATEWQAHSVRGFLSGTVRKRLGLTLTDQQPDHGARRYYLKGAR